MDAIEASKIYGHERLVNIFSPLRQEAQPILLLHSTAIPFLVAVL